MLTAQGADLKAFNKKLALDHTAPAVMELKADRSGFVSKCDARVIGETIRDLGGGRLTKESVINPDVGVDRLAKPGDEIMAGQTLARVHAASGTNAKTACKKLELAFAISSRRHSPAALVAEVITR